MDAKRNSFNVRNFIKSENVRLTSLSLPRDLSLGGNKQKKVYKPNVNVVRNKNKPKEIINRIQQRKRLLRTTQSNKEFDSNRYIQSTGVFSEGTNEVKRPKIHSDRYLNYGERDAASITVPKVVKNNWNIDLNQEVAIIDELLADDEDSSSDAEGEYAPIILPLNSNKDSFLNTFKVKKDDFKIKEEIDESHEYKRVANGYDNFKKQVNVQSSIDHETPVSFREAKLYDDDHPCISLIRMPDSLPGKGFAEDSDKCVDYNLHQMVEGKIGKVLIRKSGKVEVYIGQTKYILDALDASQCKEELMYVPENLRSSYNHDIASLGGIDEKYILSPNWRNLFDQKDAKKM